MVRIGVIGAGIIGLSSAICIQQKFPEAEITLISEKFSPETTGDGAAGIWGPYLLGSTPDHLVLKWSKLTHDFFLDLWRSKDGGKMGITMLPCYRVVSDETYREPIWKDIVFGFRRLTTKELNSLNKPSLRYGFGFTTFVCEPNKLLPYFLHQFQQAGGRVLTRRVDNLNSLQEDFDILVNCTGLEAHSVVPDKTVQPKRGQIMRVKAPWFAFGVLDDDDDGNYVIPNQDSVVLGGTHQEGDWNRQIYPEDTIFIKEGCYRMFPSLEHSTLLWEWVGLRPGRPSVRLEMETVGRPGHKDLIVIHNYGHGGSGITMCWGCAQDVTSLIMNIMPKFQKSKL